MFLVGGDPAHPEGSYADSLSLIETGLLQEYGVRRVGIAGYPEGHPAIDGASLWSALEEKHKALAERGHLRIAMAMPNHAFPLTEARLAFAREAARRLGLPPLEHLVVPRPRETGATAVATFLAAHPDVTALAAFDDDIALRGLTALHDLGVRVPEDMAVMGFDETEYGSLTTPALTTVHIDAEVLGRLAARGALGIDAQDLAPTPGRIVVRASA